VNKYKITKARFLNRNEMCLLDGVRNLVQRSAGAAKEIKKLIQKASKIWQSA